MNHTIIYDDPTTVLDTIPTNRVGDIAMYRHATYGWWKLRYVQFLNLAGTPAAGNIVYPVALNMTTVTNDITGGTSVPWAVIFGGVILKAPTNSKFGWVLIGGYYPTIATSGADDIAAGESLICHGSTDGTCDGVAANAMTVASFAVATTADVDANNTVAGYVGAPFAI